MTLRADPLTAYPLTAERLTALLLGDTSELLALALRDESNVPLFDEGGALILQEDT